MPFSVYKEKLDLEAHLHYQMEFLHKDLNKADKQKIKDNIRRQKRTVFIKTIIISCIIFALTAYIVYYVINQIRAH